MHDGKAALAAYPAAIAREYAGIVKNRSLVEKNTATMDGASEWHLVRMKVVKAGPAEDLSGRVAEDVNDGLGRVQDIGIRSQVLIESGSETR